MHTVEAPACPDPLVRSGFGLAPQYIE